MKNIGSWMKAVFFVLLIAGGSFVWAWSGSDLSAGALSRGFFVGGVLAILFGFGSLRTSYGFVEQNTRSYSTAFYVSLRQRFQLAMADMKEHSHISMILLGSGLSSLLIGFLLVRFG